MTSTDGDIRWRRRTRMVGGPLDGQDRPLPLPADMPAPKWQCYRPPGGVWQHYTSTDGRTYAWAGECSGIDHDGADPHDHDCCCGRDGCGCKLNRPSF